MARLICRSAGAVNARDRIGKGPWVNAKGVIIAKDVAELHGTNNLTKQAVLNEKGEMNNGGGDTPNRHDYLQELYEQHAGRGDGGTFRPSGSAR